MHIPPRLRTTGRLRFRRGWFGRLVPQVEVAVYRGRCPPPPGKEHPPEEPLHHYWRDAKRCERDHLARFYFDPMPPKP